MSVVKPRMLGEPAFSRYQVLVGVPGKQFSASIGFCGAAQLAKAETAKLACASVRNRILLSKRRGKPIHAGRRRPASCRAAGFEGVFQGPGMAPPCFQLNSPRLN